MLIPFPALLLKLGSACFPATALSSRQQNFHSSICKSFSHTHWLCMSSGLRLLWSVRHCPPACRCQPAEFLSPDSHGTSVPGASPGADLAEAVSVCSMECERRVRPFAFLFSCGQWHSGYFLSPRGTKHFNCHRMEIQIIFGALINSYPIAIPFVYVENTYFL